MSTIYRKMKTRSFSNIQQNTPEWEKLRRTPGQLNSSEVYDFLGNRAYLEKRKKYRDRTKVVNFRRSILQKNPVRKRKPSTFVQNLFDQGHAGEAVVRGHFPNTLFDVDYRVVEFGEIRVGVSPDSGYMYEGSMIPVEIKTQTIGRMWDLGRPPQKYIHQLIWQCIAMNVQHGVLVRLCHNPDDKLQGWMFKFDTGRYIMDFESFYEELSEDQCLLAPGSLLNCFVYQLPMMTSTGKHYFNYEEAKDLNDLTKFLSNLISV